MPKTRPKSRDLHILDGWVSVSSPRWLTSVDVLGAVDRLAERLRVEGGSFDVDRRANFSMVLRRYLWISSPKTSIHRPGLPRPTAFPAPLVT